MTLLSKYYREHPDRFTEFVIEATHSHRRMYLFDMVRYVHTYVRSCMHKVHYTYLSILIVQKKKFCAMGDHYFSFFNQFFCGIFFLAFILYLTIFTFVLLFHTLLSYVLQLYYPHFLHVHTFHYVRGTLLIFHIPYLFHHFLSYILYHLLLPQLPSIMPCFDSPNTVLNSCKGELFRRLRLQHGYKAGKKRKKCFISSLLPFPFHFFTLCLSACYHFFLSSTMHLSF